jgi:hypothetical protein
MMKLAAARLTDLFTAQMPATRARVMMNSLRGLLVGVW